VGQQESCDGGVVGNNSNGDVHGNAKSDPEGRGGSSDLPLVPSPTCKKGNDDPSLEEEMENLILESKEESNNDGKHQFCSKELMVTNLLGLATKPQQATDTDREQGIPITSELVSSIYSGPVPKNYDQLNDQSTQEPKGNKEKEDADKSRSEEAPSQQDTEILSQQPEEEGFMVASPQSKVYNC